LAADICAIVLAKAQPVSHVTTMNNAEFHLRGVGDPRLAVHATSALPVWLWSPDGTRIWWANPVGAKVFGAANGAVLADKVFGPADQHRRQVAQLAGRLSPTGAIRLERLRGFGAALGSLMTCGCSRLEFADGHHGILMIGAEAAGRAMPLVERLQRLVEGIDSPIAAFASDGMFVSASDAARPLLGFRDLSEAGLDEARSHALAQGRAETPVGIGHLVLQRVGTGADVGLVALIAPAPIAPDEAAAPDDEQPAIPDAASAGFAPTDESATAPTAQIDAALRPEPAQRVEPLAELPAPDYELPAISGEAPAEFALIDEFAGPAETPTAGAVAQEPLEEQIDLQSVLQLDMPHAEPQTEPHIEASPIDASVQATKPDADVDLEQAHGDVEAVAGEPAPLPAEDPAHAMEASVPPTNESAPSGAPSWPDAPPREHPLRFMWQMDAEGRFSLESDEFIRLIGAHTAAGFGRPWSEIVEAFGLDPDGRVAKAVATGSTWSGITLDWPVDGDGRLPVELAGLPVYDHTGKLAGYRGFGVCRDLEALNRLAAQRRIESVTAGSAPQALSADIVEAGPASDQPAAEPSDSQAIALPATPEFRASDPVETSHQTDLETPVESSETLKNVLPFRPISEPKSPALTPVENSAFDELARQLSARLEAATPEVSDAGNDVIEPPAAPEPPAEAPIEAPEWLAQPEPPPRGETGRDKMLLDLVPVGVLIYRLDRLLYANSAFLARIGYDSLQALEEAGGLDALFVEPGVSTVSSTSGTGTPVTISASQDSSERKPSAATDAHLHTIAWDGDSALALICSGAAGEGAAIAAAIAQAVPADEPSAVGHANAEELGAILDTTAEGIVMFDAEGNINSCNRSAEALFGYDGAELVQLNITGLFAPESQRVVQDYLESIKGADIASLLDHGRDALARVRGGGIIPLSMTMGRTRPDGPNFFAVFRDLSQVRKNESELQQARRLADRAATAKADLLARISHEVRTPLNAIIGFAEVMIGERFGPLGNERYVEYMKDIRASGERVIAIINDLLDLSRIETGKLELSFAHQNLNELVESCVAVMQPQANRERIIIRTSLAHALPPVIADARVLRQITLNLIGTSIHLANAGGQVIVSTALSDFGEVVLRVRDTGHGLNDNEVAAAMEPFRNHAPSDQSSDGSGVSLSLTKALVEANRAQFHIKTGPHSGTLIEVVFSHAVAGA
jgi:PAS domain S-box-containing protein